MHRRHFLAGGLSAAAAGLPYAATGEATYPSRQLHVIVPTSAGGVHDVIARIWGDRVKDTFGSIVIENRAGGGSSIALNYVAKQPPDGHLLLIGSTSTIVLRANTGNPAFDALNDVIPASIFAATSTSIAVNPKIPVKDVEELIAYLKANPGKFNYGSGGVGAITHIAVELFKQRAGVDIQHVPYRGMGPAMNDLISGQLAVVFPNITSQMMALHQAGKLRILAVNAPERLDVAPGIPTASEAGLPGFVSQIFFGLFAAKGTPKPILEKIDTATQKAWADKAFQAKLVQSGFELMLGYGPDKAAAYLKKELEMWGPVVQKAYDR
ncbi:MAG: Bug family tripartite tricarboxylate transporter substrate binding protein [Xanthobacteraceae bacterium]